MFTGGFEKISRSEAKSLVEENGGKVLGNISNKLNILVTIYLVLHFIYYRLLIFCSRSDSASQYVIIVFPVLLFLVMYYFFNILIGSFRIPKGFVINLNKCFTFLYKKYTKNGQNLRKIPLFLFHYYRITTIDFLLLLT